jgi:hypothetical protein
MTVARTLKRLAVSLPLLAVPFLSACHPIVDIPTWNHDQVKGAQENVNAGLPKAVKWCFMSAPTVADPSNVVRWDVDSDLLARQGDCKNAINHADGINCQVDATGNGSCAAFGASQPPPTVTDTVVDGPYPGAPTQTYTVATAPQYRI